MKTSPLKLEDHTAHLENMEKVLDWNFHGIVKGMNDKKKSSIQLDTFTMPSTINQYSIH